NSTLEQSISATGRYVVFYTSDPTVTGLSPPCVNSPFLGGAPCGEIMLRDMDTGTTEIVSIGPGNVPGNGDNENPNVTPDGRFVVFQSTSSNFGPTDTNVCGLPNTSGSCRDVYVRDRCKSFDDVVPGCTPQTRLVSLDPSGMQFSLLSSLPTISDDGRYVAFSGNNDSRAWLRDLTNDVTTAIAANPADGTPGFASAPFLSGNGRYGSFQSTAVYAPGPPGGWNQWVRDLTIDPQEPGAYDLVSQSSTGDYGNQPDGSGLGQLSTDGRYAVFESQASNFSYPELTRVCRGGPEADCTNYYVRDRLAGTTRHVTVTASVHGGEADNESPRAAIAGDGSSVVFDSVADDIVPGDTVLCDMDNDGSLDDPCSDVFLRATNPAATGDLTGDGDLDDTVL